MDPWIVLGDVFPDVSNPNIIYITLGNLYMNFIQKEHVKLNEIYQDTQGHFKANLSNVVDVLGRVTSKLHET